MLLKVELQVEDMPGKTFRMEYVIYDDMPDKAWAQLGNCFAGAARGAAGQGTDEPLLLSGWGGPVDGIDIVLR